MNLDHSRTYEVEGSVLQALIDAYRTAQHIRWSPPLPLVDLDALEADINGRQQFWGRQQELARDEKRA